MYRVKFEGSPDEQKFFFANYDDAFSFASMAVEAGTYQNYKLIPGKDGKFETEYFEPHPIAVTIQGVEE